ncbi:MAG: ribosome biogenesis GTPase Der [Rhodospirillaceae bacterium]|nr:ribosome biogenesis GTPase Der [Rhodospirillaceae bacterium]
MLPVVALVGRPNVGKSTLFNQLTRSRDALVADYPGLTRDRRYGFVDAGGRTMVVIDTGGLANDEGELASLAARQALAAMDEADAVVFVVDCREGLTAADDHIARRLRVRGKPVIVAVNKSEGIAPELAAAEFHALGLGFPVSIAALHGRRISALQGAILELFPDDAGSPEATATDTAPTDTDATNTAATEQFERPKLAVVGRPNVGKSTLINRLLGAERLITSPIPGTTRDSVLVPCERRGRRFVLIDTAGIRRRARVRDSIEKFSVVQSLQAIESSGVVICMLDAREGVTEQDLHLVGLSVQRGRALTIAVNKWDGIETSRRRRIEGEVARRLAFADFARISYISALHGSGIDGAIDAALRAYEAAGREMPTPELNRILEQALTAHSPPLVGGRRIRLRYAHQGGRHPPVVVVHGSRLDQLPGHYRRYLANAFRKAFRLEGAPLRLEFKSGGNPFAGRRNRSRPLRRRKPRRGRGA